MQPHPRSGRGTRLSLLGIGLLVLLSVVAFASRSGLDHRRGSAPSERYTSYAVTVFVILFVLLIPVAVYAFTIRLRDRRLRAHKSLKARFFASAARWSALALIVFVSFYLHNRHPHLLQNLNPFHQPDTAAAHAHDNTHKASNPKFQWSVLWIALVLFAGIAAYWFFRLRTAKPVLQWPNAQELAVSEDLAAGIDDAIDDLEAEPDARRAVIAAYARMEAVLGRNGFQRVPSETAIEYLRRVLLGLTSRGDAVTRLTGLFQQAKFSKNEIDGAMKQAAIGALREIRTGLAGSPA